MFIASFVIHSKLFCLRIRLAQYMGPMSNSEGYRESLMLRPLCAQSTTSPFQLKDQAQI